MGSFLLKASPWLLSAFLIWNCWSSLPQKEGKFGKGAHPAPFITADMLPQREEGEEVHEELRNPFVSEVERMAARAAAKEKERQRIAAEEARKKAEAEKAKQAAAAEEEESPASKGPAFSPFTLRLESVVRFGEGGVARISGRNLELGDPLAGFDNDEPPVLAAIGAAAVEIRHRGRTYALDLFERTTVTIKPEAPAPAKEKE